MPTGRRSSRFDPAATRQAATFVAPFQLAYTNGVPVVPVRPATAAGGWCGVPDQSSHSPRYEYVPSGSDTSNSGVPSAVNSLVYDATPQPTKTRPEGRIWTDPIAPASGRCGLVYTRLTVAVRRDSSISRASPRDCCSVWIGPFVPLSNSVSSAPDN